MTKKLIFVLMGSVIFFGLFTGCAPKEKLKSYTLQESYESGLLTLEHIKSIAYYQNEGNIESEHFVPIEKDPSTVDEKIKEDIKSTVAFYINQSAKSKLDKVKKTDIKVVKYLGTYNGYLVASTTCNVCPAPGVIVEDDIAGIKLYRNASVTIKVWNTKE